MFINLTYLLFHLQIRSYEIFKSCLSTGDQCDMLVVHRKPMLNAAEFSQKSRSALVAKKTRYCYVRIDKGQSPYLQTI
jgi:hypothetical protein